MPVPLCYKGTQLSEIKFGGVSHASFFYQAQHIRNDRYLSGIAGLLLAHAEFLRPCSEALRIAVGLGERRVDGVRRNALGRHSQAELLDEGDYRRIAERTG